MKKEKRAKKNEYKRYFFKKEYLFIIIAMGIFISTFYINSITVKAENVYTINGKQIRCSDATADPNDGCYDYASQIYYKIWNQGFTPYFDSADNSIGNLSDGELILNPNNLKNYVSHAALGACIRVTPKEYLHAADNWGHSQIIVQKDVNGFTVLQGGMGNAYPYGRCESYYTWSSYCSSFSGSYPYIKYIKWPGADYYNGHDVELYKIKEGDTFSGKVTFQAKRGDDDSNHYAIFYIDDVPITGHISSDSNGFFSVTYDTTQLSNGKHQLSVYYANTTGSDWSLANIYINNEKLTVSNIHVFNVSSKGFTINCEISQGINMIEMETWTSKNDKDDVVWKKATINGNIARIDISTADHNNEQGEYITNIYASNGSVSRTWTATVKAIACDQGSPMKSGFERTIPDGDYIIANAGTKEKSSYYYLDINGADVPALKGSNVKLNGPVKDVPICDIWSIKYSDGFYSIVQKGTAQSLDVQDASLSDDAKVMSYPSHGGDNQKWAISSNGRNGYRIQAKHSGLSLAAGQTNTNSAAVTTKISVNDDTQSWLFIPYQPKKTVSNGKYIIVSDLNSNYIMDVLGNTGDVADLTGVKLGKNTSNNKFNSFEIKALDNGYYSIVNSASGKSLDLGSANSNINNSIVVNKVNSSSFSQQWAIEKNGNGYTIKSKCSGMPLGINNSAVSDGATISQNVFTGGKEQTWKLVKAEYTVKYDLNGGTGTIKNQTKYYKNALTLSKTEPTRENYNFLGWATSKDATTPEYKAGDTYKTDKNVTLYAVWAEKTLYKIKFSGGTNATGTAPSTIKAESGKKIVLPENPFKRTCYKFIGWSDGKKTYSAGSKYTVPSKSVTLTAEWEYVPSNVPKAPDSNIKAPLSVTSFIKRCYKVALGREADPTGLQYWVDKLNGNQYTGAQIGYGFIFSDEYKAKHTSNNQFIRDLYAMYFDREPDAVGYNYWMGQLKSGVGREEVFAGFANSDEFFNLCAGYGIAGGVYVTGYNLDAQGKINCYVARLYKVCFNRLPDKAGQTYWVEQLINGKETGTTVAENMIFSTEFKNLKLNDKNYIAYLYRSIFGREPGKDEFNYWLKRLVDKAETRESIFYEFTDSVEFKNMCNSYGINP